jgi:hypothetical protein
MGYKEYNFELTGRVRVEPKKVSVGLFKHQNIFVLMVEEKKTTYNQTYEIYPGTKREDSPNRQFVESSLSWRIATQPDIEALELGPTAFQATELKQ